MKDYKKYKLEDCVWIDGGGYILCNYKTYFSVFYDLDSFVWICYKDNVNIKTITKLRVIVERT